MVTRFLQYLRSEKRYSAHTLRAYESDLQQLVAYFGIADNELVALGHKPLRAWFSELIAQGLSARSVNRKISSASAFYSYLVKEGQLAQNPIEKVTAPKNAKRLPVFYREEQLHALLDHDCDDSSYEQQRNHAMVELFYGTGMRLSELTGLCCKDVDVDAQAVKVLGKGSKQRIIPLNPNLCKELRRYLEALSAHFAPLPDSPFFRTAKGARVYPGLVYRVVHAGLEMQGVKGKKSPHVLRHSFATHMLNNGADLNSIKDLLGHSTLSATQVYTHNTVDKLLKSYHSAHPHAE
ncbi:MAG: tyrosine-type recombinase/integrase [Prevotellaceae bacterium]|jgi:integrase/recombinase XerC|nr:tyrosine-type recombinase/integrase [Prevotellaceae bacterium]